MRAVGWLIVAVGWAVAVGQLADVGWLSGGGSSWLLVLATVATLGAILLTWSASRRSHLIAAFGWTLIAMSPTVFAYPLNLLAVVLGAVELGRAVIERRRDRRRRRAGIVSF